jgi:hypothetical protein
VELLKFPIKAKYNYNEIVMYWDHINFKAHEGVGV